MKRANKVRLVFFYTLIIPVSIFLQGFFTNTLTSSYQSKGKWVAPESSNQLKNPITDIAAASKEGKKTYQTLCIVCHGDKGKGDGIAGAALTPKPSNLISEEVQKQSDGAIFWKITNGRPPMAPYKTALTEQQRWQLVTYIRSLSGK